VLAVHPLKSSVALIQRRDTGMYEIRQELMVVHCTTPYVTDHKNNAYLAQITGEPLQDAIDWHLPGTRFDGTPSDPTGTYYWFVYCAP
jgi:hypothetical protein